MRTSGLIKTALGDSRWTYIVAGSAVTNYSIPLSRPPGATRLVGNAIYVPGATDELMLLAPNGETASTKSHQLSGVLGVGAIQGVQNNLGLVLCNAASSTSYRVHHFALDLDVEVGGVRHWESRFSSMNAGGTIQVVAQIGGLWSGAGELTSVLVKGSQASGVGVGSRIALYWQFGESGLYT